MLVFLLLEEDLLQSMALWTSPLTNNNREINWIVIYIVS